MGILSTQPAPVTPGAVADRPPTYSAIGRLLLLVVAAIVFILSLVPPLSSLARRYEFAEALQFSLLAIVVPVFVVSGSPWCYLGLAERSPPEDKKVVPATNLRAADTLARHRSRHPEVLRSAVFAALFVAGAIAWRIPPMVNALATHPWLLAVEAITLVVVGVGLWLELIDSPPLEATAFTAEPDCPRRPVDVGDLDPRLPRRALPRIVVPRLYPCRRQGVEPVRRSATDDRGDVVHLWMCVHPGHLLEPGPLAAVRGESGRGTSSPGSNGAASSLAARSRLVGCGATANMHVHPVPARWGRSGRFGIGRWAPLSILSAARTSPNAWARSLASRCSCLVRSARVVALPVVP